MTSITESSEDRADSLSTVDSRPASHRVLVIDRDGLVGSALRQRLSQVGISTELWSSHAKARASLARTQPHLVLLDWDSPPAVTRQFIRHLRFVASGATPPRVIALSRRSDEDHIVTGLESGVDDYIVKPFSTGEVVARIRAVLRRHLTETAAPAVLAFRELRLQPALKRFDIRGVPVPLRAMELQLLGFFMRHPEQTFARDALIDQVWVHGTPAGARAVNVTVQRLRRALAPHGCDGYLQSVRGVGYRLAAVAVRGSPRAGSASGLR